MKDLDVSLHAGIGALIDPPVAPAVGRLATPVAEFARRHERGDLPSVGSRFRDLIPLSEPGPGEQLAFEVDLDACTGCKACVTACHNLNGLDECETWRDVGIIFGEVDDAPFQQTVTTACHHCADPGCLNGCPVMAYEKDAMTGIVRHLDDQCIGCQYCVWKCPYDVPKFSEVKGIVRKCDMCYGRLMEQEAPACVQACPNEAIRIVTVPRDAIATAGQLVPGAPSSEWTRPSTRYLSKRSLPETLQAGDARALRPDNGHAPLAAMLVLSQAAAGWTLADAASGSDWKRLAGAWLVLGLGLAVAPFHLGRPLGAWRFFLGLRTSWLSREILAFGLFHGVLAAAVVAGALASDDWGGFLMVPAPWTAWAAAILPWFAAAAAVAAVGASAMIYIDCHRRMWAAPWTLSKFGGSAAVLGCAAMACWPGAAPGWAWAGAIVAAAKLAGEVAALGAGRRGWEPWARAARMTDRVVRAEFFGRFVAGGVGALLMVGGSATAAMCGAALLLVGESLERILFFKTVDPSRMPGGLR